MDLNEFGYQFQVEIYRILRLHRRVYPVDHTRLDRVRYSIRINLIVYFYYIFIIILSHRITYSSYIRWHWLL